MPGKYGHFFILHLSAFPMKLLGKILLILLSISLGVLFIYSSYTKIYSLESFETFQYSLVQYVHLPWLLAALAGRALIGLEAAIGILLVCHMFGNRKWILKSAIALVLVFSVYLVYLWISVGNDINCGCFGDAIWMSPSTSLLKNAGLIAGLLILLKFSNGIQFKFSTIATWAILATLTSTPFFYYPLPDTKPAWLNKGRFQLDMSTLYAADKTDKPQVDLRKGKHILAFFSATCPHCRMAALKLHIMKERNPSLPIFMVIGGVSNEHMKDFWNATKAQNIPYTRLKADDFTGLVGYSWPVIYFMNNGWVEAQTNYIEMNQSSIEEWLNKP
jgi:hypothetical protein